MLHFWEIAPMMAGEYSRDTEAKMGELLQAHHMKQGQPVYLHNPSIIAPEEIARRRPKSVGDRHGMMFRDDENNELIGPGLVTFQQFEEVDKHRFVKLYFEGVKQYAKLSKAGMSVFELVYFQLHDKKEKDEVALASATSGMSRSHFSRGLRELIDRNFLFRHPNPGLFWVNIRYIFNGDRLAFVKAYRVRVPQQQPLFADEDIGALVNEMETDTQ